MPADVRWHFIGHLQSNKVWRRQGSRAIPPPHFPFPIISLLQTLSVALPHALSGTFDTMPTLSCRAGKGPDKECPEPVLR